MRRLDRTKRTRRGEMNAKRNEGFQEFFFNCPSPARGFAQTRKTCTTSSRRRHVTIPGGPRSPLRVVQLVHSLGPLPSTGERLPSARLRWRRGVSTLQHLSFILMGCLLWCAFSFSIVSLPFRTNQASPISSPRRQRVRSSFDQLANRCACVARSSYSTGGAVNKHPLTLH